MGVTFKKKMERSMTSNGRLIAIGDIHGCIKKLENLLKYLSIRNNDRVVFLGDYIGRGPNSKEVISLLIELKEKNDNVIFLLGNHENLLLEYVRSPDDILIPYLRQQHIEAFVKSYGENDLGSLHTLSFMPKEHVEFLKSLQLYYTEQEYLFVHAGIMPGLPLEKHTAMEFCEVRDIFLESDFDIGKTVVFGHTAFEMPLVTKNKIGIDTGAVYGNVLTAVVLPEIRFYHA